MTSAPGAALWKQLFARAPLGHQGLQALIRAMLVEAILDGQLAPGLALPSSRVLAEQLGVARNTVVLAHEPLRDEGYLQTRPPSGYFVNAQMVPRADRLRQRPSAQRSIVEPAD